MLARVPAFTEMYEIRIKLALTTCSSSRTGSTFREAVGAKISLNDAPTHVQRTRNRTPAHARLVQSQHVLIPSIALVATDLLLAFRIGQGGKLNLLTHRRIGQFWLNLGLELIGALRLRSARRDAPCHRACLSIQRSSTARTAGGSCFERDILN